MYFMYDNPLNHYYYFILNSMTKYVKLLKKGILTRFILISEVKKLDTPIFLFLE